MSNILLVFVGGGLGSIARYLMGLAATRIFGVAFPYGTLSVNVLGGLLMGLFIGWMSTRNAHPTLQLFFATGILGGFTTFSSFTLEAVLLWQRNEPLLAAAYIAASVILAITALCLGLYLSRFFS
ncbi:MAG: fluoride efflux transporter CrcB [Pseudomonas fluorescens]|nr:MAG: fluoride efflux transporter CrcB [Pseudomonas fluorescens]